MDPALLDALGIIVGLGITLAIATYFLGDNPIYRWALAILVGVGVGYALGVALHFLFFDWIWSSIDGTRLHLEVLPPVILGLLIWLKFFPRIAPLANIPMGFLLGVGLAVAVSGALAGTLIPQVLATGRGITTTGGLMLLLEGVVILGGTLLVLFSFSPRPTAVEGESRRTKRILQRGGHALIAVALGAAYAGALTSALTVFVERFWYIIVVLFEQIPMLIGG